MILSENLVKAVVVGGIAVGTAYLAWRYHRRIYSDVNKWLKKNELAKSALTEVRVKYDIVSVGTRRIVRKVFVSTDKVQKYKVSEDVLSEEELRARDPDMYEKLQQWNSVEQDLLENFQ